MEKILGWILCFVADVVQLNRRVGGERLLKLEDTFILLVLD